MKHEEALRLAESLQEAMRPHCERIEIAGSLRRKKPQVKDIELVCIPSFTSTPDPNSLFDDRILVNQLHEWSKAPPLGLTWIKTGTDEIVPWHVAPDGKWWKGYFPDEKTKVDIFLATAENWGSTLLIRTGSAEFGTAVMGWANNQGEYRFENGLFWRRVQGRYHPIAVTEEMQVFDYLQLEYVLPEDRTDGTVLRRRKKPGMYTQMPLKGQMS